MTSESGDLLERRPGEGLLHPRQQLRRQRTSQSRMQAQIGHQHQQREQRDQCRERAVVRAHDFEDPGRHAQHRQQAEQEQENAAVRAAGHRRRHDDESSAAEPEHDGREQHHGSGHAEGYPRAVGVEPYGAEVDRDRRAGVDGEIEVAERALDEMLVLRGELIADVGRDARLDAAGAEGHERKPHRQGRRSTAACEHRAAGAVHERERHDGAVLAPEHVRDDGADQREEVGAELEQRLPNGRLRLAEVQILRHVDGEDGVDAVEAEALGELVGDDERDAGRHPVDVCGAHAL